jgi:hypothetical protein
MYVLKHLKICNRKEIRPNKTCALGIARSLQMALVIERAVQTPTSSMCIIFYHFVLCFAIHNNSILLQQKFRFIVPTIGKYVPIVQMLPWPRLPLMLELQKEVR